MKYKIYCINLFEREDRYIHMKNEFLKYKLDVCFIRNYKHKLGGRYGCFSSHIQCIKDAKQNNVDFCLIFEDDVKLVDNCIENIDKCIKFIKNNKNVEIIYSQGRQSLYINELYYDKIYSGKSMGTDCIIITKTGIDKITKKYKKYINNIHYDAFLYLILNKSFINTNYITSSITSTSDNTNWINDNIIFQLFQKMQNYTTLHLIALNFIVINIFKILIKLNNNALKTYLINNINRKTNNIIKNYKD